ncbi:sensor histidine kinase [Actinocrispum sp. NPDC049592]|uniref:sensor histidine kinase n=1 Tax=Actinocrispum sp. NPDC049592 TaxID=3154835 RepID=UPI00343602C3
MRPRWHYLVGGIAGVYALYGLVASAVVATQQHGWLGLAGSLALYVFALALCVIVVRRERDSPLLMAIVILAGVADEMLAPFAGTGILFLAVWLAPFKTRLLHTVLLVVWAIAGFWLATVVTPVPSGADIGIAAGLGWAAFLAAIWSQLMLSRRQAATLAEARVLAERQRLAREIHDVLAHSLSAQVVHLEGTRMLLENGADPAAILERVVKAGDMARAGLEETKRAVAALRGDEPPLADQLSSLATEFHTLTGNACEIEVSGDPDALIAETRLTVLRTAQEALTNVRKHSPGASVRMALHREDGWCSLEVVDTGGDSAGVVGTGYGLVGMRERAELIGGELDAGPVEHGFRVRLRVPA